MKVVITGGSGFIGARLARKLLADGGLLDSEGQAQEISELVLFDQTLPDDVISDARVEYVQGDLTDRELVGELAAGAGSVFHFASVVSGGAEADLELGYSVNLDGTRGLLDAMAAEEGRPKLVFASSCGVYSNGSELITDATTPTPKSSYGVQKMCLEYIIGDYSRRGLVDGRSMRFPTIAVRPGKANLANSSFISNIVREPLAGRDTICQVPRDTYIAVMSPGRLVDAILKVHNIDEDAFGWPKALLLPSINLNVDDMLQALARQAGEQMLDHVRFEPDADIVRMVLSWPQEVEAKRADAMGIFANADADEIVAEYIEENHPKAL